MATVATVDGHAVPVREFELFIATDRAATFAYFEQRYGDADKQGFWTTAYGGQTPRQYLRKLAMADAVRTAVQQELGQEYALAADSGCPRS